MIRNEKGQAIVEFALVVPILLLLLVGIIDIGRLAFTYSSLHFTAQETVRVAGIGKEDLQLDSFARNNLSIGDSAKLQVLVTPQEGARKSGEYVTVTLKYPVEPFLPFADLALPEFLRTDSTIRIE
ncbi:TadE/TadG family type IV pilus assembly protein [Oceanobacillus halophilus]|uniref:Pilus assembly protein n=1 Tax=Oceanobacillus halophilus TaxID=930130 RepID=A0A495A1B6_9BACI|nr:TadE/TadG family type IV pilus assembly protein [Oceanobacillus halophilus]RKQ33259.1 pilus assembly protein [Oceanobacillus halophilus]